MTSRSPRPRRPGPVVHINKSLVKDAAQIIVGAKPTEKLVAAMAHGAGWAQAAHYGGLGLPTIAEQKKRLDEISAAATTIINKISDGFTPLFIANARCDLFFLEDLQQPLLEVIKRAGIARAALGTQPSGRAWPLRQGKIDELTLDGRLICAITVIEAWSAFHGCFPRPGAAQQQSCAYLWEAIGSQPLGKTMDIGTWRSHLGKALKTADDGSTLAKVRVSIRTKFARTGGNNAVKKTPEK